jgi:hypothetical protein
LHDDENKGRKSCRQRDSSISDFFCCSDHALGTDMTGCTDRMGVRERGSESPIKWAEPFVDNGDARGMGVGDQEFLLSVFSVGCAQSRRGWAGKGPARV